MKQLTTIAILIGALASNLKAQDVTITNSETGQVNTLPNRTAPPFTTVSDIVSNIGQAPATVAKDGYNAFKQFSITNPIAGHVIGLMNGKGKYGVGLEVNQADPNQVIGIGFAVAGIQTDKDGAKKWNFYDATLNLSVSKTETIPLLNIPVTVRVFSGPFASLNGGVLMGLESGTSADIHFKLADHWALELGGGIINCSGAAAEGLKPVLPMAHLALAWSPKGW